MFLTRLIDWTKRDPVPLLLFAAGLLSRSLTRSYGLDQLDVAMMIRGVETFVPYHPVGVPFLILLARLLNLLTGSSITSLVWISVISGSAFVSLTYMVGKEVAGRFVALGAALLLFLTPEVWLYSSIGMSDIVQASLVLMCILWLLRYMRTGGETPLYLAMLTFGILLGVKSFHAIFLAVFMWVLMRKKPGLRTLLVASGVLIGAVALGAAFLWVLMDPREVIRNAPEVLVRDIRAFSLFSYRGATFPRTALLKLKDIYHNTTWYQSRDLGRISFGCLSLFLILAAWEAIQRGLIKRSHLARVSEFSGKALPWIALISLIYSILSHQVSSVLILNGTVLLISLYVRRAMAREKTLADGPARGTRMASVAWRRLFGLWIAVYSVGYFGFFHFDIRYYLPIMPALAIVIVMGFHELVQPTVDAARRWVAWATALTLLTAMAITSLKTVWPYHKTLDTRSRVALKVNSIVKESPVLLLTNNFLFYVWFFEANHLQMPKVIWPNDPVQSFDHPLLMTHTFEPTLAFVHLLERFASLPPEGLRRRVLASFDPPREVFDKGLEQTLFRLKPISVFSRREWVIADRQGTRTLYELEPMGRSLFKNIREGNGSFDPYIKSAKALFAITPLEDGSIYPYVVIRGIPVGEAYREFDLAVPSTGSPVLENWMGMQMETEQSNGVRFALEVEGKEIFSIRKQFDGRILRESVDLSPFKGRRVRVRLRLGNEGDAQYDYAAWIPILR